MNYFGEFAALLTAVFWTVTSLAFERATKLIGSLSVNLIRLVLALIFLSVFSYFYRGYLIPLDASQHQWIWLPISGLIGFVMGDYFLFRAFQEIGARISMLIMALVPPISAIFAWMVMDETMTMQHILAMIITLVGIVLVILNRKKNIANGKKTNKIALNFSFIGLLFALGGATGQAIGLVYSKYGMQDYDAFSSSQIRVFAGLIGYVFLFLILKRWKNLKAAMKNRKALKFVSFGAFTGPFLGVSFSLLAVQHANTGVAATLMSITPVLIIIPTVLVFKEKIKIKEIIGAIIAVIGVAIFFL